MSDVRTTKSYILGQLQFYNSAVPLEKIVNNPKEIHYQAISELLDEDRITSAGDGKWELL